MQAKSLNFVHYPFHYQQYYHLGVAQNVNHYPHRVRLSAHTAIQFYDVQDRLGYDRPSKAVDWLIKKAKTAIDKLAELPAWKPTLTTTNPNSSSNANLELNSDELNRLVVGVVVEDDGGGNGGGGD
ncbi:hypothetical protein QVD17_00945 [Tagetes erecta]|uniref:TCP domain-containing protein n=1 Tax=Tagetes erecta TaxID=13708 RepID=A0AAD8P7G4_TARER|nr:hypothetical protein QVD17_00945 [Tagetes erecta]